MPSATPVAPVAPQAEPAMAGGAVAERKLTDFLAETQGQNLGVNQAAHLANPAALAGETVRHLHGFFQRAETMGKAGEKRVTRMSDSGEQSMAAPRSGAALHGGPARENFGAPGGGVGGVARTGRVTDQEMEKAVEALMDVLRFGVETNLVASGTAGIPKSVNTLLRGQ